MTNKEMMRQLYERMAAEQQKYKAWLLEQPPNVILDNACKFTVREDIGRCTGCDRGPRRYRHTS